MDIYIIRHGQTEWNKLKRWQGNKDIPLDETGINQSMQVAKKLEGANISRIYASPLIRAAETAKIIQKTIQAEIILLDSLKEIKLGEWEGLTQSQIKETYRDYFTKWETGSTAQIKYGVESYFSLQNRAFSALNCICSEQEDSLPILLVTHGAWILALMCKLLHMPLERRMCLEISNTGVTILKHDKNSGDFKVLSLNSL